MIKKILFILFVILPLVGFTQDTIPQETTENIEDSIYSQKEIDSIIYDKNIDYAKERNFNTELKDKYSGNNFTYVDDEKTEEKKKETHNSIDFGFLNNFGYFMSNIFPFIVGFIVVLIILKTYLGSEANFWNFKKSPKKISEKLVYEDENIDTDFYKPLKIAIKNKEYRVATRYYYLILLKKMTQKKYIEYHKEKTNSEYLFEIDSKAIRQQFSYLSYIYTYVWYGKFLIDEEKFKTIAHSYTSFLKTIH